jgi:hypothetical protein
VAEDDVLVDLIEIAAGAPPDHRLAASDTVREPQTRREIVLRTKIELDRGIGIKLIGTILNRRQYFTPAFVDRHL